MYFSLCVGLSELPIWCLGRRATVQELLLLLSAMCVVTTAGLRRQSNHFCAVKKLVEGARSLVASDPEKVMEQ